MPFIPSDTQEHKETFLKSIEGKVWSNDRHQKAIVEALDRAITEEVVTGNPNGSAIAQNGWMSGVLDIIYKIVHHGNDDALPPFAEYEDPGIFYDKIVAECFEALNRNEAAILGGTSIPDYPC